MRLKYGPEAWQMLNGVFCLHKPRQMSPKVVMHQLRENLTADLNCLIPRPPAERVLIKGDGHTLIDANTNLPSVQSNESRVQVSDLSIEIEPKFSDHPLVVGPRYQPRDLSIMWTSPLPGFYTSGLLVGMIGRGCAKQDIFRQTKLLREYELCGTFGQARHNYLWDGRVVEKTTHRHITASRVDRICSKFEATQRAVMFDTAKIDLRSQDAYEAASRGLIRPSIEKTTPVIYSIKLVEMQKPHFKLSVVCINEYEPFLANIIHEMGLALKSSAYCTKIRLAKFGPFTSEMSLLEKHWTLPHLIRNINVCSEWATEEHLMPKTAFVGDTAASSTASTQRVNFVDYLKSVSNSSSMLQ